MSHAAGQTADRNPHEKRANLISPTFLSSEDCYESDETEMSAATELVTDTQNVSPAINVLPAPKTAFGFAFQTPLPYFSYMEVSRDSSVVTSSALLRRFGAAMQGSAAWEMKGIVAGFDWQSLMEPSKQLRQDEVSKLDNTITIVDVGGGIGACCMALVRAFPEHGVAKQGPDKSKKNWRFIVQDRQKVVKMARDIWEKEGLGHLVQGDIVSFVGKNYGYNFLSIINIIS